jgi:hypothetical protein
VLHRHLDAHFIPQNQARAVSMSSQQAASALSHVLSLLAWEGQSDPDAAAAAFAAGMNAFVGGSHSYAPKSREACSLADFDNSLQQLRRAVPAIKRRVVVACAACILANQEVTVREAELLRAICDTLDCPMPPLALTPLHKS